VKMSVHELSGKVQTVCGLLQPDSIANTLMHEHIFVDVKSVFFQPPEEELSHAPFTLENLHWIQYNYQKHLPNLILDEFDIAEKELQYFKQQSGNTIVDVTTHGIGRNPRRLREVSLKTEVNVVAGAGYYVGMVHPADMGDRSEKEIEDQIVKEVVEGIDGTDIRAGIIGEIGCSWPLSANEIKVLKAAARAQKRCGSALSVHPGRSRLAPKQILDILREAGADLSRVVLCHVDRTTDRFEDMLSWVSTGCILEYDLFGMEISQYPFGGDIPGMPNDTQRIQWVKSLIDAGFTSQVVLSHDIYSKHRLNVYGGHGYAHILKNIVPRMEKIGITKQTITNILQENPRRLLTFL